MLQPKWFQLFQPIGGVSARSSQVSGLGVAVAEGGGVSVGVLAGAPKVPQPAIRPAMAKPVKIFKVCMRIMYSLGGTMTRRPDGSTYE